MAETNRPVSPHLQIYRLPLTGILSISHRVAGVALTFGLFLLFIGLLAIARGEDSYIQFQSFIDSFIGGLIVYGWIFALFFHFCHGIRHLIWDIGKGFEKQNSQQLAIIEIVSTVVLTVIAFAFAG